MRFLPPDDKVVLYETVFEDDILDRKKVAVALSDVVSRIEDPLVIALDGGWGTGKTYFLKRWVGSHYNASEGKSLTVYFDAFAHDYMTDPLIGLVSVLAERAPKADQSKVQRLKKAAAKFIKPSVRLSLALASYGATEVVGNLGDAIVSGLKNEADAALNEFWAQEEGRRVAMGEFHAALETLTALDASGEKKSVVLVVDELDRCRPDYALEVLEVVKHFFSVRNVHFVLGANFEALENSVKARYGDGIDARSYLKKFISFSAVLPDEFDPPQSGLAIVKYAEHVGTEMGISEKIRKELCRQIKVLRHKNSISIRDTGKLLSAASILLGDKLDNKTEGYLVLVVSALVMKNLRPDLFARVLDYSVERGELVEYWGAKPEKINQKLESGEYNDQFDNDTYVRYSLWVFFLFPEVLSDDEKKDIGTWIDRFGMRNSKGYIRHINEGYLNIFKAFER